jgi:hypothetical protein
VSTAATFGRAATWNGFSFVGDDQAAVRAHLDGDVFRARLLEVLRACRSALVSPSVARLLQRRGAPIEVGERGREAGPAERARVHHGVQRGDEAAPLSPPEHAGERLAFECGQQLQAADVENARAAFLDQVPGDVVFPERRVRAGNVQKRALGVAVGR